MATMTDVPPCTPEQLDAAASYYASPCACGHVLLFHVEGDPRSPGRCTECACVHFGERVRERGPDWPPRGTRVEFRWLDKPCWGVVTDTDCHGVKVRIGAGSAWTWLPRSTLFGKAVAFRVVSGGG